jgi:galactonate dehydratase
VNPRVEEVESTVVGDTTFVRVHADTGLSGIGQSACWGYPEAVDAVVRTFRNYLRGQEAFEIERHWQYLYRMAAFRGSILSAAISAVDIALWDLKGKHFEVPIYEFLGGRVRHRVRLHALILGQNACDVLVGHALEAVAEGFSAIKFQPLPPQWFDLPLPALLAETKKTAEAVREAVGPNVDLIVELHRGLSPLQARSLIEGVRTTSPLFIEDPIQIDSIMAQAEIARGVTAPLGQGERLNNIWEITELLALGGSQYIRADVGQAGGVTHCKKIAAIAEAYHSCLSWHNYLGPVLTAASAQLDACVPNVTTQEYYLPADEGPAGRAFQTSVRREGGELIIPDAPGLGVEVDEKALGALELIGRKPWHAPTRRDGLIGYAT